MRAVRLTKAEVAALREIFEWGARDWSQAETKAVVSILAKLEAAEAPAPGTAVGPLEAALVAHSRGKVVELRSGGSGYARASKLATQEGVTVEDAALVGAWLARQGWLREPTTILGVLNKWSEWLPRARATAPPPAAQEGFDVGAETAAGGAGGAGRRGGSRGGSEGFR